MFTAVCPGRCFRFYVFVRDVDASGECWPDFGFGVGVGDVGGGYRCGTDASDCSYGIGVGAAIGSRSFVFLIQILISDLDLVLWVEAASGFESRLPWGWWELRRPVWFGCL